MRPIVLVIVAFLIGLVLADVAQAKRRRLSRPPVTAAMTTGTYQERAQAEANYMADHNHAGHVGRCIATFEGVGYNSTSPNCNTCTPGRRRGLTLVADAVAQSSAGRYYRVRAWGAKQARPDQAKPDQAQPDQTVSKAASKPTKRRFRLFGIFRR